jgi:hypothetical protein
MNFKKQAEKLENFLEEEFKKELPIALLNDGSLVYAGFRIKPNNQGTWNLLRVGGYLVDRFNLKACALMAAKYFSINKLTAYNEIKQLDSSYQQNATDATIFKHRYITVKDLDRRDLALWRWELTDSRARQAKTKIAAKFKSMF